MTLFSLTPTFTQGLVLGQLSILLLLASILRYLFFDTHPTLPTDDNDYTSDAEAEGDSVDAGLDDSKQTPARDRLPTPSTTRPPPLQGKTQHGSFTEEFQFDAARQESLEWFNLSLDGVRPPFFLVLAI